MMAHNDIDGFWTEYLTSTTGKIEFLQQTTMHPCWGSPDHTWSDAEREIIKRLRRTNLLDTYKQRLHTEEDTADRAELAWLMAMFNSDIPPADPGTLRTVLFPTNRPIPARSLRNRDGGGQLTLGLG